MSEHEEYHTESEMAEKVAKTEEDIQYSFASTTRDIPRRLFTIGGRGREGMCLPESPGRAITLNDFEREIAEIPAEIREKINICMLAQKAHALNMARGDKKSREEARKIIAKYPTK